jgi:hypothetical protein
VAPGKRAVKSGGCPGAKWCRRGTENRRRVCTWFASRWRNHQPKRAEKPHSIIQRSCKTGCWTALLRGRILRLPWRIASGSRQPRSREAPNAGTGKRGVVPFSRFWTICRLTTGLALVQMSGAKRCGSGGAWPLAIILCFLACYLRVAYCSIHSARQ